VDPFENSSYVLILDQRTRKSGVLSLLLIGLFIPYRFTKFMFRRFIFWGLRGARGAQGILKEEEDRLAFQELQR
jgi:hypothetical protein